MCKCTPSIRTPFCDNCHTKEVSDEQVKAMGDCYDLLAKITMKQNYRIIRFEDFYGDGTRFPLLTREGVAAVYESTIETWEELGVIS